VFIFTTMLTVALATKKLVSFAGLGAKKRNLERLEREISAMEEEAREWLAELVRRRTGGEEPPPDETRGAELAGGSLRLQLDRALREKEELREEVTVLRRRVRGGEGGE
jgi:hypothetical protein